MRAAWVVALWAAAALGGCAGSEGANPNLAAPKLVVAARPDGNVTLFVHGAFGDRIYDWVHVAIDNQTLVNRTAAFSVETSLRPGFFVNATAGLADEMYWLRARIEHDPVDERLSVSFLHADEEWSDADDYGLPFERLLERRSQG